MYSKEQLENLIQAYTKGKVEAYKVEVAIDELTANDVKAIVDGNYPLLNISLDEDMYGLVLSAQIGGTGKYFLTILADIGAGLQFHKFEVDGDVVDYEVESASTTPESLIGKFVRIMDAPTSTTLTDEQIAQIIQGVFINGDFLDYHNPILLPSRTSSDVPYLQIGVIIGTKPTYCEIGYYQINTDTKTIGASSSTNIKFGYGYGDIELTAARRITLNTTSANVQLYGKNLPKPPADASTKTYILKLVNGSWEFIEEV